MDIERAGIKDIEGINALLRQVLEVHHKGRPDIFKGNTKKYTDKQLEEIIKNDETPIFVVRSSGRVTGYAFCIFKQERDSNVLTDIKTLYIDDLCVDESARGQRIGSGLYEYVKDFAKKSGCYNVTLNVWSCNEGAARFYEKCGLKPQKTTMEAIM
ncbi:MAG: GNAT family N-acetyltransferase [Clostridiales bacterium]|nr:GNAT family N-acetyltransferase [Clostridiales bacterium]